MDGMDRKAFLAILDRLDDALTTPQTACVIGGGAVIGLGNSQRLTQDIDIWRPASRINDRDLAAASRAAGIGYDPVGDDPDGVYLQIVTPGVVQMPGYEDGAWATGHASGTIWSGRNLVVTAPPADVLIASKMVRADDRDIDDAVWLVEAKAVDLAQVRKAIAFIPDRHAAQTARENLTLLEIVLQTPARIRQAERKTIDPAKAEGRS